MADKSMRDWCVEIENDVISSRLLSVYTISKLVYDYVINLYMTYLVSTKRINFGDKSILLTIFNLYDGFFFRNSYFLLNVNYFDKKARS